MIRRLQSSTNFLYTLAGVVAMTGPATLAMQTAQAQSVPVPPGGGSIPVPVYTVADIYGEQQEAWETIFMSSWDEDNATYPLMGHVTDVGTYAGINHHGEGFVLDVVFADILDWDDPELEIDPLDLAYAEANDFEYTTVMGILSTDLGSVAVSGVSVASNELGLGDTRFMMYKMEDPNGALFQPDSGEASGDGTIENGFGLTCIPIPIVCPDEACEQGCEDAYQDAVDQAHSDHTAAVDAANSAYNGIVGPAATARDNAISAANATYDTTSTQLTAALTAALLTCTYKVVDQHIKCARAASWLWFAAVAAQLACIAASTVTYAICSGGAIGVYNDRMALAEFRRNDAISDAQSTFNAIEGPASEARDNAISDANADLAAAIRAAEIAKEQCLDGCTPIICDWWFVCIPIIG